MAHIFPLESGRKEGRKNGKQTICIWAGLLKSQKNNLRKMILAVMCMREWGRFAGNQASQTDSQIQFAGTKGKGGDAV